MRGRCQIYQIWHSDPSHGFIWENQKKGLSQDKNRINPTACDTSSHGTDIISTSPFRYLLNYRYCLQSIFDSNKQCTMKWRKQWKQQNEGLALAVTLLDMGSLNWHSYGPELERDHIHLQSASIKLDKCTKQHKWPIVPAVSFVFFIKACRPDHWLNIIVCISAFEILDRTLM